MGRYFFLKTRYFDVLMRVIGTTGNFVKKRFTPILYETSGNPKS